MGQRGQDTSALLIAAALDEFNCSGFFGTDSNKIARLAGYSPQTFYRWFVDKTAIFLAAYSLWQAQEAEQLQQSLHEQADTHTLARLLVAHHRHYRVFRRSLRLLTVDDDRVRQARALGRSQQIMAISQYTRRGDADKAWMTIKLFQLERLSDGLADDEFADLGIAEDVVLTQIAVLMSELFTISPA